MSAPIDGEGSAKPDLKLNPLATPADAVNRKPRVMGLNPGAMIMAPNFNDPMPDEFWLGDTDTPPPACPRV